MEAVDSQSDGQLTVDEAAVALGVSSMTIRRMIKRGELKAAQVQGKYCKEWRIELDRPIVGKIVSDDSQINGHPSGFEHSSNGDHQSVNSLIELVRELHGKVDQLQNERADLYGRIGYFQAQLETAKEQVRLLTSPARIERRPWWVVWRR